MDASGPATKSPMEGQPLPCILLLFEVPAQRETSMGPGGRRSISGPGQSAEEGSMRYRLLPWVCLNQALLLFFRPHLF